jgi:hypothetical protein
MARTPDEIKKDFGPMPMPSPDISVPVYPYGLCLSFTEDDLDKLEIDPADCEAGDIIDIRALAKVTSYNERIEERSDGTRKRCCRIELQITHLALEDEDDEGPEAKAPQERARRRYGGEAPAPKGEEGKAGEMHVAASSYRSGRAGKPTTKAYSGEGEAHLRSKDYKAA